MKIKDRNKDFRRVKAEDLLPNPNNWRPHLQEQLDAIRGVLSEIGWAGAYLACETKDGLMLIDCQARLDVAPGETIPVLVLDVTEDEANKLLATYDPTCAMAETD